MNKSNVRIFMRKKALVNLLNFLLHPLALTVILRFNKKIEYNDKLNIFV